MKRIETTKVDNRTSPERQAAKLLGVTLKNEATDVSTVYGAKHAYTQVWWTECGNNLVIDADDDEFRAALCPGDFEWDYCAYNDERDYAAIAFAAGLR